MSQTLLDAQKETQVVAMIARGDTYTTIIDRLKKESGIVLSQGTLTNIKNRNGEALAFMKNALAERETIHTTKLLDKSRKLIERKLDRALDIDESFLELHKDYKSGEIDEHEFRLRFDQMIKSELSTSELTSLSKEMFNQSQIEQGKPTTINTDANAAKEKLSSLLLAIKKGDDVLALEALFN